MKYAIIKISSLITLLFCLTGCQKYLDVKQNKKLVIPTTLRDIQALLNSEPVINSSWPTIGAVASDDYYVTDINWQSLQSPVRDAYLWKADATASSNELEWSGVYTVVFNANLVLDYMDDVDDINATVEEYNELRGHALFLRAWAYFEAASAWALPYNGLTASETPGIPLRNNSNVNNPTIRYSLKETYDQILADASSAASLLPAEIRYRTRPSRPAAWALLARVHLTMGNFVEARKAADSSLQLYSSLMDYNTLNAGSNAPVPELNNEVLFHALCRGSVAGIGVAGSVLAYTRAKVDSLLYRLYEPTDLRKTVFFAVNADKSYYFKGNYHGSRSFPFFTGLAVDEMFLTRAECAAREGDFTMAMNDLNQLLSRRYKPSDFIPRTASNAGEALEIVLIERRKELCFRGNLRWMDIRRLNQEASRQITLRRNINSVTYELLPGAPEFAWLLPQNVVELSGISQNKR